MWRMDEIETVIFLGAAAASLGQTLVCRRW